MLLVVLLFIFQQAALMKLLSNENPVALDLDGYCTLPEANQLVWELRVNALNRAMLYLMNSKNKNANKDLRLAFFPREQHRLSNQYWING